ncbi:hypothetical protein [Ascidiimonas aurantiaca]|uniref:hypothetical protein n=1 Tax=Ascidiimonas aurantiaca TaxID=1685432 RepID=UPI0030EB49D3
MKKTIKNLYLRKNVISQLNINTAYQLKGGEKESVPCTVNCTSRNCDPLIFCNGMNTNTEL